MKKTIRLAAAVAVLAGPVLGAPVSAAGEPPSYDDPAMHYAAPDGWTKLDLPPADSSAASDERPPAAVFLFHRGQADQRSIVIDIQSYSGSLDAFEREHESDIRSGAGTSFIDKRVPIKLANGMPAYFVRITQGSEAGQFVRRYDYLVVDGKRSIDLEYTGRQGDYDDKDVQAAFASLSVTLYPANRS